ncbi:uncharacterized protein METZ01_LOCUS421280 [marine metagenome]|uniref:Uncharacterized protein n=1 Tax=marine metagenome TaxID=408172 RepID=A0A382XB73_9ZZZZ
MALSISKTPQKVETETADPGVVKTEHGFF